MNVVSAVRARPKTSASLVIIVLLVSYFALAERSGGVFSSSGELSGVAAEVGGQAGSVSFSSDSSYEGRTSDESIALIEPEQEIVVTGFMTVKVKDPVGASETFISWVEDQGGYVEDLQNSTYDDYADSTAVVRVKDSKAAVKYLKSIKGEVLTENLTRTNVTAEGADLDARIAALRQSIDRLSDFLDEAKNYQDLFQVETELTNRQAELDSIVAQREALSAQVEMSTLSVTFTATEKLVDPSDEANRGFKDGLRDGWNGVATFLSYLVYLSATAAPWLIVVAPLTLLGFVVLRFKRRARKA